MSRCATDLIRDHDMKSDSIEDSNTSRLMAWQDDCRNSPFCRRRHYWWREPKCTRSRLLGMDLLRLRW